MAMHKIADLDDAGSIPARLSRDVWQAAKALADAYLAFLAAENPVAYRKRWLDLDAAEKAYREATRATPRERAKEIGSAGGKARAKALTPAERSAIGRKGAEKRWAMYKDDGARSTR